MCSRGRARCVLQKTVRLVVNYLRTQKAVVRVSPEVPLQNLLPLICAKCDVSPEHVVLLRDNVAGEELELSKSLSQLGIKELYAWDNQRGEAPPASPGPRTAVHACAAQQPGTCLCPRISDSVQSSAGGGAEPRRAGGTAVTPLSPGGPHASDPPSPVSVHETLKRGRSANTGALALKEQTPPVNRIGLDFLCGRY